MKTIETVLVTGAAGALGEAVVSRFLADGSRVIAVAHAKESPTMVSPDPLRANLSWISLDLGDPAQVRTVLSLFKKDNVDIDVLVHCAGGFRWSRIDETNEEDFDFLIDANLRSTFHLMKALLPDMKERGYGRMVFVGANAALNPTVGMGPYCASKAGLHALVQAAAAEVKGVDININAVLPSIIDTPTNRRDMPAADHSHWVSRESLAEIIHALTRPWGSSIHGALIPVTGRL